VLDTWDYVDRETKLEKARIHRAKTTWNSIEQNVLAARQQMENKLLLYKAILKNPSGYDVQLWGTVFEHRNATKISK